MPIAATRTPGCDHIHRAAADMAAAAAMADHDPNPSRLLPALARLWRDLGLTAVTAHSAATLAERMRWSAAVEAAADAARAYLADRHAAMPGSCPALGCPEPADDCPAHTPRAGR